MTQVFCQKKVELNSCVMPHKNKAQGVHLQSKILGITHYIYNNASIN